MAFSKLALLACAAALCSATPAEETQFVAAASPTHFEAVNPNPFTALLVLGDVEYGARAQMLIAPGASFSTSFPSGTLEGLYLEVVFFSPAGRFTSGAVSFESMLDSQGELLEVDLAGSEIDAWIYSNGVRMPVQPNLYFVPPTLINSGATYTEPLIMEPSGVPVITPTDIESNNVAPKIRPDQPMV